MVGQQHSSDYKLSAIKHYEKSGNLTETCRVFDCYRKTLKLWYDKYKATGNVSRKARKEGSYKIKKQLVQYAITCINDKPDIIMNDLLKEIQQKFPDISISRQHLGRILRNENKTRKRLRHVHQPATYWGKPRNHEKEITDYFNTIKQKPLDKIIALDETGIYASLKGSYGRCNLGSERTNCLDIFPRNPGNV